MPVEALELASALAREPLWGGAVAAEGAAATPPASPPVSPPASPLTRGEARRELLCEAEPPFL